MSDLIAGDIGVIADPASEGSGLTCAPWATSGDVCAPCVDNDDVSAVIDDQLQVASDILFLLSGRRWPGVCSDTVRPCARPRCHGSISCSCGGLSTVVLGPNLVAVSQVKVDGEVLSDALYRVDTAHDELVRLPDANGSRVSWPCCQRLDLADTEDDTFSVTYTYGAEPPVGGVKAAAELACELALSCTGGTCRLPKRVQTVTRQGVTVALIDSLDLFERGMTGLPSVDLWLKSVNPNGLSRRAKVLSPDTMQPNRRIG